MNGLSCTYLQRRAEGGKHTQAAKITTSGRYVNPCEDVLCRDKEVSVVRPGEEEEQEG